MSKPFVTFEEDIEDLSIRKDRVLWTEFHENVIRWPVRASCFVKKHTSQDCIGREKANDIYWKLSPLAEEFGRKLNDLWEVAGEIDRQAKEILEEYLDLSDPSAHPEY